MENKKMRCHISIIIEECWKIFAALVFLLITDIDDTKEIGQEIQKEGGIAFGIVLLIILAVFLVVFLWSFIRWRKTTILLEDDVLIWEKATLNKKTLTINVQNISSLNLEQNLLERLLNTSRLKIDTSSLYTVSIGNVLLVAVVIIGFLCSFLDIFEGMNSGETLSTLAASFAGICTAVSFLMVLLKRFFTYYDLTAGRKGGKIFLQYGLLKKREYTIPVETVNALKIQQTMIGRIFRRYHASIECIGVGDENNETAQLTLSLPYEEMLERVANLLPEYEINTLEKSRPVPKKALCHALCGNIYLILAALISIGIIEGVVTDLALKEALEKNITILEYNKLQYLEYTKSPLTHWTGLYDGMVHILSKSSVIRSPMMTEEEIEYMKRKCMEL